MERNNFMGTAGVVASGVPWLDARGGKGCL